MEPSRFEAQLSSLPLRHASVSRGLTIHSVSGSPSSAHQEVCRIFFFFKQSVRSEGNRKPRGAPVFWGRPYAVDCGETEQGAVREEIMVGSACGGKPGSHGSKETLLSQRRVQ